MGIIKALKLGFDYQRYDDDGNVVDMQRAVNDVNLDIGYPPECRNGISESG